MFKPYQVRSKNSLDPAPGKKAVEGSFSLAEKNNKSSSVINKIGELAENFSASTNQSEEPASPDEVSQPTSLAKAGVSNSTTNSYQKKFPIVFHEPGQDHCEGYSKLPLNSGNPNFELINQDLPNFSAEKDDNQKKNKFKLQIPQKEKTSLKLLQDELEELKTKNEKLKQEKEKERKKVTDLFNLEQARSKALQNNLERTLTENQKIYSQLKKTKDLNHKLTMEKNKLEQDGFLRVNIDDIELLIDKLNRTSELGNIASKLLYPLLTGRNMGMRFNTTPCKLSRDLSELVSHLKMLNQDGVIEVFEKTLQQLAPQ